MRALLILLTAVLLTTTANAQFYEGWPCKIKSQSVSVDVGVIKKGNTEKLTYSFINDGTEPLSITVDKGASEDFRVMIPEGPIKSGNKGTITIGLNAKKSGKFREKVLLNTSCRKDPMIVEFFGSVGK